MNQPNRYKAIKVKRDFNTHKEIYVHDCNRIQNVLLDHGYFATLDQIEELWERVSEEEFCASWLILPDQDKQIWEMIKPHFEEV